MSTHMISTLVYKMNNQIEVQMIDQLKQLGQIRKRLKWSQQKVATELGVSISTVARWESGKSNPGNLASDKIAQFIKKNK